jgi:acetyl-CoA/propionyl-CoA carboxylase biotin carboxyl carrier protein
VHWNVTEGDLVQKGDVVAVLDAMKMETSVTAPASGIISIRAAAGSFYALGVVLANVRETAEQAGQETSEIPS